LSVIVLGDRGNAFGLVVDRLLGERELVVQPLDARLGKVKDISAAAVMEDGLPVLIVDGEDMIRSVDKLISGGRLTQVQREAARAATLQRKRVLVVDDSLTVRELERKLLSGRGYEVEVAVDGMDGWNAVRTGHFNLVVTDIDMPRMDGIELVNLIRRDAHLKSLRVMVVSSCPALRAWIWSASTATIPSPARHRFSCCPPKKKPRSRATHLPPARMTIS
jgi:two-component system sensor histidine kinase and response regulator WspE